MITNVSLIPSSFLLLASPLLLLLPRGVVRLVTPGIICVVSRQATTRFIRHHLRPGGNLAEMRSTAAMLRPDGDSLMRPIGEFSSSRHLSLRSGWKYIKGRLSGHTSSAVRDPVVQHPYLNPSWASSVDDLLSARTTLCDLSDEFDYDEISTDEEDDFEDHTWEICGVAEDAASEDEDLSFGVHHEIGAADSHLASLMSPTAPPDGHRASEASDGNPSTAVSGVRKVRRVVLVLRSARAFGRSRVRRGWRYGHDEIASPVYATNYSVKPRSGSEDSFESDAETSDINAGGSDSLGGSVSRFPRRFLSG
ncbi:hypothetical protein F4780DRAFT_334357 [Xylariomycetidae sp. FL0641]|nr:hypothetical protein F4780DRAFT_334357 [Xylariomycetidae sp. FL0641]